MEIVHEAEQDTDKSRVPALQPTIRDAPATDGKETAGARRWVENALEDDEVREALKLLHARDASRG